VLAAIDFHALGQVIWVSFVAGVGVTVLFSFSIFAFGKADESRRGGDEHSAWGFATLGVVSLLVFAVAVVVGVAVMLHKS
jgi:hypothetical protein